MKLNRSKLRRLIESVILETKGAPVIHDKVKISDPQEDRSFELNPGSSVHIETDLECYLKNIDEIPGFKSELKFEVDGRTPEPYEIENVLIPEKYLKITNISDKIHLLVIDFEIPEFAPSEYYGREDERPPPEPGDPLAYRGGANPSGMSWAKDIDTDRDRTNPRKK